MAASQIKTKKKAVRRIPVTRKKKPRVAKGRLQKASIVPALTSPNEPRLISLVIHEEAAPRYGWVWRGLSVWALATCSLVAVVLLQYLTLQAFVAKPAAMAFAAKQGSSSAAIIDHWSKPAPAAAGVSNMRSFADPSGEGLTFQYPAGLGAAVTATPDEVHFSNNPDVFAVVQRPQQHIAKDSLLAQYLEAACPGTSGGPTPHCQPLTMAGSPGDRYVGRFLDHGQPTTFLVGSVAVSAGLRLTIFADLGQPPLADRNVFAPMPAPAPEDSRWNDYFTSIDSNYLLAPVIADNVAAWQQIVQTIQVKISS